MKGNFVLQLSAILLIAACSQLPDNQTAPPPTPPRAESTVGSAASPATQTHVDPAAQLQGWYDQTVSNCGSGVRPAFLCSGVMLRGTISRQSYLPWDPSPASIRSGGVSFAWIRADTNFQRLPANYNNGYIFYPVLDTPAGKNSDIEVMCSFPFDGWTDVRNQQGCGTTTEYPTHSRPCNDQGINTGQQWISHFNASPDKYKAQCGWNVREGQPNTADRFYQSIDGRSRITSTHWNNNNELRLATWATGSGAQLPIQSFFYLAGTQGLVSAQDDQRRYHAAYGQVVPVVQLSLASSRAGKASFVYRESDQVVESGDYETITFEDIPLQEGQQEITTGHGTFRWKAAASGWIAIRDRTPPSRKMSGHHLVISAAITGFSSVDLTLASPASRISFDVDYPSGGFGNASAHVHLSDGSVESAISDDRHVDYTAPAGLSIVSIDFLVAPKGTALDTIRLYN